MPAREQQPVERIARAVLFEELACLPQALGVFRAAWIADELAVGEVLLELHVAPERAFAVRFVEFPDERAELRILLAHCPGERRVSAELYCLVHAQLGQDRCPEFCHVARSRWRGSRRR